MVDCCRCARHAGPVHLRRFCWGDHSRLSPIQGSDLLFTMMNFVWKMMNPVLRMMNPVQVPGAVRGCVFNTLRVQVRVFESFSTEFRPILINQAPVCNTEYLYASWSVFNSDGQMEYFAASGFPVEKEANETMLGRIEVRTVLWKMKDFDDLLISSSCSVQKHDDFV